MDREPDDDPAPRPGPREPESGESRPGPSRRGQQALIYLGIRSDDGSPVEPGVPPLSVMVISSVLWGLVFPLLDGHPHHSYLRDVAVDIVIMFVTLNVIYRLMDWWRRGRASST